MLTGLRGLLVALLVVAGLATPDPAAAVGGAALSSESVYRVDLDTPAVSVATTYRMSNISPDRGLGGGQYEYTYFTGLYTPIHLGATGVTVEVDGRPAEFTIVDGDDGWRYLDIMFGYELRHGNTATIVVRYSITGDPPRDPDSWVRVNPAYAAFELWAMGDAGEVGIRVEVPEGLAVQYTGDDLRRTVDGDLQVFEVDHIGEPDAWWTLFTVRRDDRLESTRVDVDGDEFVIRSWPGDDEWKAYAQAQITGGVPVLEEVIGADWPVDRPTEVLQAATPYLSGYAGFYDSFIDRIEIGEDLDRMTFLHELSHAWVNGNTIADRWLVEGLAEEIATRGVSKLGETPPGPRTDADLRRDGVEVEPFPLNTWSAAFTGNSEATEDYGYAASFRVIRALGDEIGEEPMTRLLTAVLTGERAYPDEDGPVEGTGMVDWRAFLDLAEQIGGSEQLEGNLRRLVLIGSQVDLVDERADALVAYDGLVVRGGEWHPPASIREAMAAWSFGPATHQIEQAAAILDRRDELVVALEPLGLDHPDAIEMSYQTGSLDDVDEQIRGLVTGAERLAASRDELTGVLDGLGLTVPELTQDAYEASPDQALDTTLELVDAAASLAETHAELTGVLADHDMTVPDLPAHSFADDPAATQAALDERLGAARAVGAAHDARDEASSLLERIGSIGSDVDDRLTTAGDLLARGDYAGAAAAADAVRTDVAGLGEAGTIRVASAGGVVVASVVVVAAWAYRRRRRPEPADAA